MWMVGRKFCESGGCVRYVCVRECHLHACGGLYFGELSRP